MLFVVFGLLAMASSFTYILGALGNELANKFYPILFTQSLLRCCQIDTEKVLRKLIFAGQSTEIVFLCVKALLVLFY